MKSADASIGASLSRQVLLIGATAALAASMLLSVRVYFDERALAQRHMEEIQSTQLPALTTALWEVDPQRIDDLLDGIAQRSGVTEVRLTSREGESWQSGSGGESNWLHKSMPLLHPLQPQAPLGDLEVTIGSGHGINRVLRQLPLMVAIVLIAMLGAAWAINRRFRVRVAEPLRDLAAYAQRLDEQDLSRSMRLRDRSAVQSGDEIDQLVEAFEQARSRLQQGLVRQAEQAVALRRHSEELEQEVARRTAELQQRVHDLATAQVEIEAARSEAEQYAARASDFAEISADGFWETDADLRLVLVSSYFAKLMGSSVEQMLGKTPEQAYRERFPEVTDLDAYTEPLSKREAFDQQLLLLQDRAGKRHWVINKGKPMFDRHGEFQGYRGAITDITESRRAQRELEASEHRFRMITDNVPALISYIDSEQRFRFNNKVYQDWLRMPLEEITDRRLDEVYGADVYRLIEPHLESAFAGERVSFELELQGRTYRATYVPDLDQNGQTLGIYGLIHDITRLKRVERDLRLAADFDALTGLPNRRHFEQLLERALQRSEREGHTMALMYIDLDHFKAINDELGHAAGDAVLRHLARILQQQLRATDTPARLAGDEFVVILENLRSAEEADRVATKLIQAIAEPMEIAGTGRVISASVGLAVRLPGETDPESLLRRADTALYDAKDAGRGCWRGAKVAIAS